MTKRARRQLAARWEKALPRAKEPTQEQWGETYKKADPESYASYADEEDAEYNALYAFEAAAEDCRVDCVSLDFPDSQQGDGASVEVYLLPAGTSVLKVSATYALSCPPAVIYRGANIEEMMNRLCGLLYSNTGDGQSVTDGDAKLRKKWMASKARIQR